MKVLVTGAGGFVGRNLVENLKNIRDGKNKIRPNLVIDEIYEYDKSNTIDELGRFCSDCDFVFNLVGENRPKNLEDFRGANFDFVSMLIKLLKKYNNKCPVMHSSSVQASLAGRFGATEYGLTKKAGEKLFFKYGEETGIPVFVYRFPNIVGKWIKPNYNSAIGTFCYNIANELPIKVNDPNVELDLLFIDDLIDEMFCALEKVPHRCEYKTNQTGEEGIEPIPDENGRYCYAPITHKTTLGYVIECLNSFHEQPQTLIVPTIASDSFEKKLYSMYLSYLPKEKMIFDLKSNSDIRGSFTEIIKTLDHGQFSVNISNPGVTKGQHWHNSKWEFFVVVFGHAMIRERKIGTDEVLEFEVSGDKLQAVHMLPGYVHNITNLSKSEKLVTLMWANEIFNKENPDTFSEQV